MESKYRQILDSLDDLVLLKGPQSKIVWANSAFRRAYRMSLDDLRDLIDGPHNRADFTQQYVIDDATVFRTGLPLDIPFESIQFPSGETRHFHTLKSPIFNESGEVIMTVGVSRDITERVHGEAAIAAQKEKMLQASKMSSLGEMAGGIAHEINNPLAIIQAMAGQICELLEDESLDRDAVVSRAADIEKTADRIAKIVRGLRTFSRDDAQDAMEQVSPQKILDDTISFCGARFRNHETALSFAGFENASDIECHPAQISQVLLNLLNNAHDAVSTLPDKWVRVAYAASDKWHEISVEDSGMGISVAVADKIMLPFFTTKEIGKGTGLGLSISKGIMAAHGGELFLDRAHERTRFVLRIPLNRKAIALAKIG